MNQLGDDWFAGIREKCRFCISCLVEFFHNMKLELFRIVVYILFVLYYSRDIGRDMIHLDFLMKSLVYSTTSPKK
jgi:hypothetical protein